MSNLTGTHGAAKLIADNMARLTHSNGVALKLAGWGSDGMAPARLHFGEAVMQMLDENGWDVVERRDGQPSLRQPTQPVHPAVQAALDAAAVAQMTCPNCGHRMGGPSPAVHGHT